MFSFAYPYGRGGRVKKAQKPKKANWFEELTIDQNKQLCRACSLPVSGTKMELVSRLLSDDYAREFSGNERGNSMTLDFLKKLCRQRLLQVGGNKFDLVLRIIQERKGTGGESLKRAAVTTITDPETGEIKQVAKKHKPNKPSPKVFYNRVQQKIKAVKQKKYQTYWGAKSHSPAVEGLICQLMRLVEPYLDTDPELACNCYISIVSSVVDNFGYFERFYFEELESIVSSMKDDVCTKRDKISRSSMEQLASLLTEWESLGEPYGLFMSYDMDAVVKEILGNESDEDADQKPAASTVSKPPSPSGTNSTAGDSDC